MSCALEHVKWGHSWRIIKSINVHTAIGPIRNKVLKAQGLKLWGRKTSKGSRKSSWKLQWFSWHFEGVMCLVTATHSSDKGYLHKHLPNTTIRQLYNITEEKFSCTSCSEQIQMEAVSVQLCKKQLYPLPRARDKYNNVGDDVAKESWLTPCFIK